MIALKRPVAAVQVRAWPPLFQALSSALRRDTDQEPALVSLVIAIEPLGPRHQRQPEPEFVRVWTLRVFRDWPQQRRLRLHRVAARAIVQDEMKKGKTRGK